MKLEIICELLSGRATGAEIAQSLGVHRSGVYRHLQGLEDEGYVEPVDSQRKWTYYNLTSEGERIGHLVEEATQ